jgi:hypothetical protein
LVRGKSEREIAIKKTYQTGEKRHLKILKLNFKCDKEKTLHKARNSLYRRKGIGLGHL